jgi:hypothetical protein
MIPIGSETQWGTVHAVGMIDGERYYWMIDRQGTVSMIPASTLEESGVHNFVNRLVETTPTSCPECGGAGLVWRNNKGYVDCRKCYDKIAGNSTGQRKPKTK